MANGTTGVAILFNNDTDSELELKVAKEVEIVKKTVSNLPIVEEHTDETTTKEDTTKEQVDKSYVLLPWVGITNFILDNFKCRECDSFIDKDSISKVQVGLATSLNFFCDNPNCQHIGQLPVETRKGFKDEQTNKGAKKYITAHQNSDYSMNLKMVMAMQQLGCSQTGAAVVGGMLLIAPNVFNGKWTPMEEELAKIQVSLGEDIIDKNIEKEKALSEKDDLQRYLFCVSIDAGWNNRGSGKSYNSDSGHHITVGNRSSLVVALYHMSRCCAT
jgi:hypothetical protein